MTDRYIIVSDDWRRFDRRYAVIDRESTLDRWVIQTNSLSRAVEVRDEMNAQEKKR